MGQEYALVNDIDDDSRVAGDAGLPERQYVDIGAGPVAVGFAVIVIIPLQGQVRVIEDGPHRNRKREFHFFDPGDGFQDAGRLGPGHVLRPGHLIEKVQSRRPSPRFEFPGIREYPPKGLDSEFFQRRIHRRGLRPDAAGGHIRLDQGGHVRRQPEYGRRRRRRFCRDRNGIRIGGNGFRRQFLPGTGPKSQASQRKEISFFHVRYNRMGKIQLFL